MPGHNHYLDCTCGWCWHGASGGADNWPRWDNGPRWPSQRATVESYTIPNAHCPVCGEPVFFYRSPYNGRVFFDELGPPWPKHPCTDNPRQPVEKFSAQGWKPKKYQWQLQGWEPAVIEQIEQVNEWARLKLRPISSLQPGFIIRATPWREELAPGLPAHIKPLDAFGIGHISILYQTPIGEQIITGLLVHRTLVACEVAVLEMARKNDAEAVSRVADSTYRAWGVNGTTLGSIHYPKFVDFRIAKKWLEKAGELGDEEAKRVLKTNSAFAS